MGWLDRLDRRTTGIVLGLLAFALYLAAGEPQAIRDSHYPFAQAFLAGGQLFVGPASSSRVRTGGESPVEVTEQPDLDRVEASCAPTLDVRVAPVLTQTIGSAPQTRERLVGGSVPFGAAVPWHGSAQGCGRKTAVFSLC